MWMQEQSRYENTGHVALWGLLFAAPLLTLYVRTMNDSSAAFNLQEVFMVWRQFAVYLLLFLVHNFILAPLLIYRHKRWFYALLTLCMIGLFIFYQCSRRPDFKHPQRPSMELREHRGPRPMDDAFEQKDFDHNPPPFEEHDMHGEEPKMHGENPQIHREKRDVPPVFVGQHDIVAIVILILMCGMNLGVKLYFKSRNDQKKLKQLEQENLQQQLEYLKYQINPHFFMNTLNNIHALVDIDPEKAKDTILELSKMMRFILYEGDKKGVPLSKEFEFIRTYIQLMKLRYTDKVRINVDLPTEAPDKVVPPLMLISFVENAFKHGISYQHESFIDIKVAISDKLFFSCRNSKADKAAIKRDQSDACIDSAEREQARLQVKPNEEKGGVGLQNVKQRLNLLYDNNYTLNIQDGTDVYNVELTIPL